MTRTVPEWIGKTDDAMPPPRVRLRIFQTAGGLCHISGRRIQVGEEWDCDHVIPLADGGENRESNLRPAIKAFHRKKTAAENSARAVTRKAQMKNIGIKKPPKRPMPGSKASKWKAKVGGGWERR